MTKSPPRIATMKDANFTPRFAYGEQAQISEVCGVDDGSKLGAGFVRMTNASIPWTIKYDEVILVLDGDLTIRTETDVLTARAQECIWLPAGTALTYETESALLFYAIQPADWATDADG